MTDTDADERRADYRASPWERRMQTFISALVLAGVIWLASTTNETAKQLAVMETRLSALTDRFEDMRKAMDNQDGKYASRFEMVTVQKSIEALAGRVERMENKR